MNLHTEPATVNHHATAEPATKLEAAAALTKLRGFIGNSQLRAIAHGCCSEERQFFYDKVVQMTRIVESMPTTYQTDGQGDDAIVHLHYFGGGSCDWFITERDSDPDGEGQQQAFGLADLGYGGELGYISIAEIIELNIELDLYFRPRTLGEIKAQRTS